MRYLFKVRKIFKVRKNYLAFILFFPFVFLIMLLANYTALDRDAYLFHFSNPLYDPRIEIGFVYYMVVLKLAGVAPVFSVALTSLAIYYSLFLFWLRFVKSNWLFSFVIFNFFVFSLMNVSLGIQIRMGLAGSIAILAFSKVLENKKIIFLYCFSCL